MNYVRDEVSPAQNIANVSCSNAYASSTRAMPVPCAEQSAAHGAEETSARGVQYARRAARREWPRRAAGRARET